MGEEIKIEEEIKHIICAGVLTEENICTLTSFVNSTLNGRNNLELYNEAINLLNKIVNAPLSVKCSFIQSISFESTLSPDLSCIFHETVKHTYGKKREFINHLSSVLYRWAKNKNWQDVVQTMWEAFSTNQYNEDYMDFFSEMCILEDVLKQFKSEITVYALEFMLSKNASKMFYSLGLLLHYGGFRQENLNRLQKLNVESAIYILKCLLYFTNDEPTVCKASVELLPYIEEHSDDYTGFCLEEIFKNYPETLFSVAKMYLKSSNASQVSYSKSIVEAHELTLNNFEYLCKIKDLYHSEEHTRIYEKALEELSRERIQRAGEASFFSKLLNKRTLKYGARIAFVTHRNNDDMFMNVSPYHTISHKKEMPAKYVENPVGFTIARKLFLREMISDETDS